MDELNKCRNKIDDIDNKIIDLFISRMDIVKEVVDFKRKNNIKVLDFNREKLMLENNLKKISKEEYKKYYKYVLDGFLQASKKMQEDIINKKI